MESIVVHLIEGTTPDKSPRDISLCLSNFMHEMNVTQLSDAIQKSKENSNYNEKSKNSKNEVDGYLRSIWTQLLNCASHSSSSVRVAAYSATWSFLMKTMPTYPILMRNSFSDIVDHFSGESNVSILLISSFAFISHFVSPNKMQDFLDKTPLFHHFIAKESINSEHLSNIISNLSPHLSNEWYKNLLLAFIKLCKVQISTSAPIRHVFKAIAALIKKNQALLLPEILVQDEKNVFPGQLSLISFILSSSISSLDSFSNGNDENSVNLDDIDLKKTAIAAFESLKDIRNCSMTEIDDSLTILSLRSKSFKVTVSENEQKSLVITLEDHGSFIFDDQKTIQRPSFYLLPLPKGYLLPNVQTETSSIIGAKLKTIGRLISDSNQIQDVDLEIDMLDELCSCETYNETVSHCLHSISLCVNSLILNTKSNKLSKLLRKLLFTKTTSWFHAFNILMVIKSIRIDLISTVLGPSGFRDIIKTLVSFCMNVNQDLSRGSFDTIIKLTTDDNFYEVTNLVAKDIDFFNSFSLQKNLLILSGLIPLHQTHDLSHLYWLFYAVVENIPYHIYDIDALAAIFPFLSFFKMSKLSEEKSLPIIKIAQMILKLTMHIYRNGTPNKSTSYGNLEGISNSSINLLNQESILSSYNSNKDIIKATFHDIIRNYIESKKTEIVSLNSYDYHIHFIHVYSVMLFLLSLKPSTFRSQKMTKVLLWCFRMFPDDCSYYFSIRLKHFNNEQILKIIKYSYPYLDAIPDISILSIWCEIAQLQLNFEDKLFKDFWYSLIRNLFESVRNYAMNLSEKKISLALIVKFSYFFGFIKSKYQIFSIDIKKLNNKKFEKDEAIFSDYIRMFLSKLSDIKKIQFLQIVEKDKTFKSNFPDIIFDITSKYFIPKSNKLIEEYLSNFKYLIEPQKNIVLNDLCRIKSKLPKNIPDIVINYSKEKLDGWNLLIFYKKLLNSKISDSLKNEIEQKLNVEPRAFNPVCQQTLMTKDPQKRLQLLSNKNSIIAIKTVFCLVREAFDNNPKLIDFSSISFNQSMIPCVAKFIQKSKIKQTENLELIEYFKKAEEKLQIELPLLKYFFNPNLQFKLESNQRKLTKFLIYQICQFMQEFKMTLRGIENEILLHLKETKSFNRIKALLTLSSVHISMIPKQMKKNNEQMSNDKLREIIKFIEIIFDILKSKIEDNEKHKNKNSSSTNSNETNNTEHHYHKNDNIIPQKELLTFALCVNEFINENNTESILEKYISFIDHYCNLYVFPDCLTLHLKLTPRIKFEESINDIIMNSNHPSFILQSIRALRCITAIGDMASIRLHIENYINKFHQLHNIYPISYYVSYFLFDLICFVQTNNTIESQQINLNSNDSFNVNNVKVESNSSPNLLNSNIINDQLYISIRKTIMNELFGSILVPISKASFYPLAKIIVALVESETKSNTKSYLKLVNQCEKIVEDGINSFLLFKLYLEILTTRIRKISDKASQKEMANDHVIKLLKIYRNGVNLSNIMVNVYGEKFRQDVNDSEKVESTFDSYFIDDYLNAILKLMNEFLPFDDVMSLFVKTVFPEIPRFFPSLVALVKICKNEKSLDKDQSDVLNKSIDDVKLLLNDNQIKALDLLMNGPMSNEVLNLSIGRVNPSAT